MTAWIPYSPSLCLFLLTLSFVHLMASLRRFGSCSSCQLRNTRQNGNERHWKYQSVVPEWLLGSRIKAQGERQNDWKRVTGAAKAKATSQAGGVGALCVRLGFSFRWPVGSLRHCFMFWSEGWFHLCVSYSSYSIFTICFTHRWLLNRTLSFALRLDAAFILLVCQWHHLCNVDFIQKSDPFHFHAPSQVGIERLDLRGRCQPFNFGKTFCPMTSFHNSLSQPGSMLNVPRPHQKVCVCSTVNERVRDRAMCVFLCFNNFDAKWWFEQMKEVLELSFTPSVCLFFPLFLPRLTAWLSPSCFLCYSCICVVARYLIHIEMKTETNYELCKLYKRVLVCVRVCESADQLAVSHIRPVP